jgi:hypothetical protein
MQSASLIMFALCLVTQVWLPLWAFKPNNNNKTTPSDITHESITMKVIERLDKNELFHVTNLTDSMTRAAKEIADGNAGVDLSNLFFVPSYHFDDEEFAAGQNLLVQAVDRIKDALNKHDTKAARRELGRALHTLQDFYSHTNWLELGNTSPNSVLGKKGQTIRNAASKNERTCNDCTVCVNCTNNLITQRLTSGWFGLISPDKPNGKCSHGGTFDRTARRSPIGGINKDTKDCDSSPHSDRHEDAANLAERATENYIRDLVAEISLRQRDLLFGRGPTIAMAIDTTGSMGPIIENVKAQAIQIVNSRLGTDEEPSKYVLASFNDPAVSPPFVTNDPDAFKSAISSLFASCGGDCPELSMTGVYNGLGATDEGGDLFAFTDASAKDSSRAGDVESLALSKDIKIFPLVFGSCSPIDPVYVRLATATGGQFFFLQSSEAASITKLADAVVRSNGVDLLSVGDTLAGAPKTYSIPVDSTMSSLTVSLSGVTSLEVRRPTGSVVSSTDADATFVPLSSGIIVRIASPVSGAWSATVSGSGIFSLLVAGESDLRFSSFRFTRLAGRPGHEGYFPIDGLPLAGQTSTADAVLDGPFTTAQFELRNKAGAVVQVLALSRIDDEEFLGDVVVPSTPFIAYVTGTDASGKPYQRVLPGSIGPTTVKVTAPDDQYLRPGQTTTYTFQVTNLGPQDTFQITATDDQGYVQSVSPTTLTLKTNETAVVTVTLQPGTTAQPGTTDTLTVTAQSPTSGARNFAVVESLVVQVIGAQ